MSYFELKLASRHLIYGRGQTLLTMVAVAVAVVAIVFIQSLISGVKKIILRDLLRSLPDITIRARDQQPRPLAGAQTQLADAPLFTLVQKQGPKRDEISDWPHVAAEAARFPNVRTVASVAIGNAELVRGEKRIGIVLTGGDPTEMDRLIDLQRRVVAGAWLQIKPDEIAISWKLAEEANVRLGDRIRLESPTGNGNFRLTAILSTDEQAAVYTRLRTAQSLFGLRRDASRIYIKVNDPFAADQTTGLMAAVFPYRVESWTRENGSILGVFKAQDGTSLLVSIFSLFGSAFAVASVLIISVTQKSKQIGILKSMGANEGQILRVFTCEALLIGVVGSLIGAVCSYGMIYGVNQIPNAPSAAQPFAQSTRLFVIDFEPSIYIVACLVATLATMLSAILPARRAARLDPVQAIRS